ncbi:MAG: putative Ig domain-containing protein, partial [Gammaproteobacteria bacterium]
MDLSASLSRLVTLTCLTLFLSASLVSPADAGSGNGKGWGKKRKDAQSNSVPSISGVPAQSVAEGSAYVFRPSASDADGDSLTFSVQNQPSWASFSSSSGRLSGTPTANHVGTYDNITITVSDGSSSASLSPFSITVLDNG